MFTGKMIMLCFLGYNVILLLEMLYAHPCDDRMRVNIAFGKPANQSSPSSMNTNAEEEARKAVDGNKTTICQVTNVGIVWWYVDLEVPELINGVKLLLKKGQNNNIMENTQIEAGPKLTSMELIGSLNSSHQAWTDTLSFNFTSKLARYVRITSDGGANSKSIQLAEVEIFSINVNPENLGDIVFAPSFISSWRNIKSDTDSESEINFQHNLQEYPVKVSLDVVVNYEGVEYSFTGLGAPETDEETNSNRGGVLCLYNQDIIRVLAPARHSYKTGYVINIGKKEFWDGPDIQRNYSEAKLRVRAWKQLDFPDPEFQSQWTDINSQQEDLTFFDVPHNMGSVPDLVVVQVYVNIPSFGEFIYEAQGIASRQQSESGELNNMISGCVFGFSNTSVRIWIPFETMNTPDQPATVLFFDDGYGVNRQGFPLVYTGRFRITAWKISANVYEGKVENLASTPIFTLPFEVPSNSFILSVEAVVEEGANENYRFYGIGSSSNDGNVPTLNEYEGVVYAHSGDKILFWTPSLNQTNGSIFGIGGTWGGQKNAQMTNNVTVKISVWVLYERDILSCSEDIENGDINNSSLKYRYEFQTKAQIDCNQGYSAVDGENTRICDRNCQWNTTSTVCRGNPCDTSNLDVENATYVLLDPTTGNNVTYTCNTSYTQVSGDMVRFCQTNGEWNGTAPNCSLMACRSEDLCVNGSTFTYTGLKPGDTVTYKCKNLTKYVSGDLLRTCQLNGNWSGIPPFCEECPCKCVDKNEDVHELIKELQKALTIKKNATSNSKRKLISVYDGRTSAVTIGYVGVAVISIIGGALVIPDLISVLRYVGKWLSKLR